MDFETVRSRVAGVPHMDAHHGRLIYDHVRQTRPSFVLELGSAQGVSAAYICAALEANDHGRLLSVDIDTASYEPRPPELFARVGLSHRADFVRVPDSSYVWLLREQVASQSDAAGNCEPLYDFVFIDGAHEFTIDGIAVVLAGKLLKPGGWLLLDDLDWTHSANANPGPFPMSAEQLTTPNVREVFELLVKSDPSYAELRVQDENWGWARKGSGPRTLTLDVSETPTAVAMRKLRAAARAARRRRPSTAAR